VFPLCLGTLCVSELVDHGSRIDVVPRLSTNRKYSPARGSYLWGDYYRFWSHPDGLLYVRQPKRIACHAPTQFISCFEIFAEEGTVYLEKLVMALKRLSETKKVSAKGPAASDGDFLKSYPSLFEQLTSREFGKGEPRKTSSLSIFADNGAWKAFLNERNDAMSLCVSADSFTGVLDVLEAALGSSDPDWRPSPFGRESSGKKK